MLSPSRYLFIFLFLLICDQGLSQTQRSAPIIEVPFLDIKKLDEPKAELMQFEIRQIDWVVIQKNNPSLFQRKEDCPHDFKVIDGISLCENYPVENLSIQQVFDFIKNINQQDVNYTYRLPTIDEWRQIAQAQSQLKWPGVSKLSELKDYCWYDENSSFKSHRVALLKPNALGFFDMMGNVSELVTNNKNQNNYFYMIGGDWSSSSEQLSVKNFQLLQNLDQSIEKLGFRLLRSQKNKNLR